MWQRDIPEQTDSPHDGPRDKKAKKGDVSVRRGAGEESAELNECQSPGDYQEQRRREGAVQSLQGFALSE